MSASSPRKPAPAKKAPAKAAPKRSPLEKVEANIEQFDDLRARARNLGVKKVENRDIAPYVLGPERGFDPPIEISFPTDLPSQIAFDQAARADDVFGMLGILTGKRNLMRIATEFDRFDDGMSLMAGLVYAVLDRFRGPGAGDVPGGTQAS